jgi:hypothetical protein
LLYSSVSAAPPTPLFAIYYTQLATNMISLYFLDRSVHRGAVQISSGNVAGMKNQATLDHIAQLAYIASSHDPNISTTYLSELLEKS